MTTTGSAVIPRVLAVLLGTVVVIVVGVPALAIWWLSTPAPAPSAEASGTMERLRNVAYALRDEDVRKAVENTMSLPAVARSIGAISLTSTQIRAASSPGEGRLVLVDARATGSAGVSVDVIESHVPAGQNTTLFAREVRPWVGCYRVELPVVAIAATTWTAHDVTCPTFNEKLQHADRVHVDGAIARPLLRPPCYGTSGYCPGG